VKGSTSIINTRLKLNKCKLLMVVVISRSDTTNNNDRKVLTAIGCESTISLQNAKERYDAASEVRTHDLCVFTSTEHETTAKTANGDVPKELVFARHIDAAS
jgi:hypothetical protein